MSHLTSFSVFPYDIWDILLNEYIIDSKSWLYCMYASKSFLKDENTFKFKQNIVLRLLPEVLMIVQTKGKSRYLDDDDIKNLRLVSKTWRLTLGRFNLESPLSNRHVCGPTPRIWVFKHNVDEILSHFASASSKIYNLKSLHVAEDLENDDLQKVTQILEIVGSSLVGLTWCTGTYIKYQILTGGQWYKFLITWLNLLPKLESLQISVVLVHDDEDLSAKYKSFTDDIKEQLAVNHLPNLRKLLTLKYDDHVPIELLNHFINQNNNTQTFRV